MCLCSFAHSHLVAINGFSWWSSIILQFDGETTNRPLPNQNTPVECRNHRELNTDTHLPRPHTAVLVHIEWGSLALAMQSSNIWNASNRDTILQNWTHQIQSTQHTHSLIPYLLLGPSRPNAARTLKKVMRKNTIEQRVPNKIPELWRRKICELRWMNGRTTTATAIILFERARDALVYAPSTNKYARARGQERRRDRTRGR